MLYEVITAQFASDSERVILFEILDHRITSYNVCYTKLLRGDAVVALRRRDLTA